MGSSEESRGKNFGNPAVVLSAQELHLIVDLALGHTGHTQRILHGLCDCYIVYKNKYVTEIENTLNIHY